MTLAYLQSIFINSLRQLCGSGLSHMDAGKVVWINITAESHLRPIIFDTRYLQYRVSQALGSSWLHDWARTFALDTFSRNTLGPCLCSGRSSWTRLSWLTDILGENKGAVADEHDDRRNILGSFLLLPRTSSCRRKSSKVAG